MKFLSLILLSAIGYIVITNGGISIELPKKHVYIQKECPLPVQCPQLPENIFTIETLEKQFCKGDIETFLMKEIKQVKVDVEEKLASY
jgi:hypothetical protein